MFNFKPDRVNWNARIGSGAFGKVYPYQKDPSDTKWVVKNIITKEVEEVLQYFQEITIGFSCNNPHVLPVKGYYIDYNKGKKDWDIYIKFPRLKSSLRTVLNESKKNTIVIPEREIVQYFYDIIQGLEYLHEKGIAHRDIKPDNILIGENGDIKIADFGLGSFHGGDTSYALAERAGTIFYAAPENRDPTVELTKQHLLKADLWSLGILMYELCSLEELRQINFYAAGEKAEADINIKLREMNGKYSKKLINLIGSLLKYKPSERKSLKDLREELVAAYGDSLKMMKENKSVQTEDEKLNLNEEPNKILSEKEESQEHYIKIEEYSEKEEESNKILSEKEESYEFDFLKVSEEIHPMEEYYKLIISIHEENILKYESRIEELKKELEEAKEAQKKTQELYADGEMEEIYKTLVLFPKYFDPALKYKKSELPSGATLDYATNPDDSDFQNSFEFLEMMTNDLKKAQVHPYLEEKSDKGKIVQKKLQTVFARIRQMETAFEDKRMDRPKYIDSLKKSIVHDKELCKLYLKRQDKYREKFLLKKIKITQNEIEELEKFPGGKSGIFLLSTCGTKQQFTEAELPFGMTLKQATNLDDVDFYCCLSFLNIVADDLRKVGLINGIFGQKVIQRIKQIEAQFASGALDKLVYIQLLKKSIIQDQELSQLYISKKDKIRANFMLEKAKHEQKEATELEENFGERTMLISILINESLTTIKTELLEYANQPLDINSQNCLSFLKVMADDLNKAGLINGKYGRKVSQKIKSIETQLANGTLDKLEYLNLLEKSNESDQVLCMDFIRKKEKIKAKFVLLKIKHQMKEISDASRVMWQPKLIFSLIYGYSETIKNELPKSTTDPFDPGSYNCLTFLQMLAEGLYEAGLINTKFGKKISQRFEYIETISNKISGKLELLHLLRESINADSVLLKHLLRTKQKEIAIFIVEKVEQERLEIKELQENFEKETSIFVPEYYYWPEFRLKESELPPTITLAYATEPDNSDFHNGLSFLKVMADETERTRVGLSLDPNKVIAQLMLSKQQKLLQRIKEIEVQLEKDTFSRIEYLKGLKASVAQDQELCNLYIAKNEQSREKFLMRKIKQTQEEIELTEKVEDRLKKI